MDKFFYIDLNETPPLSSSPREQQQQDESLNSLVALSHHQKNVRVCSSCEFVSRKEEVEENQHQQQKEEWKCFRCVLGCPSRPRGRDDGGSSSSKGGSGGGGGDVEMLDMNVVPPLDMNVSPPREGEGEGLFHFVDLNKDLPVVEENHKAKYEFYFFIYPFIYV